MAEKNEVAVKEEAGGQLSESGMAQECSRWLGAPAQSIINLLRDQIIAVPMGKEKASGAETALVLSVMNQYKLDPFARMVSAWRDWTGKLCIQVEQNGWTKMAKSQPGYLRASWEYGPIVASPNGKGKDCYEWVGCTIHDSILGDITAPRVWLDEEFVGSKPNKKLSNWEIMPKRRLPQRAYNNALRFAYGFSVYDSFDHELMDDRPVQEAATDATQSAMDNLTAAVAGETVEAEFETVDEQPGEPSDEATQEPEGEWPPTDTGTATTPSDGDPGPPVKESMFCSVAGCQKHGSLRCGVCGERFCSVHIGDNGMCKICGSDETTTTEEPC